MPPKSPIENKKKKLVISFSGGLTSAYMTKQLLDTLDRNEWEIAVIFANTGKEREETFQFILDCDKYWGFNTIWVEAVIHHGKRVAATHKVITYETASRKGEPFKEMTIKYGLPNAICKHCTRELKIHPIRSYAKKVLGWKSFYTAMGIRFDEARRITKDHEKMLFLYPLIDDYPTDRIDVNRFWKQQSFTLKLKSYQGNCDFCVEKSKCKLLTLIKEDPEGALWWKEYEDEFEYYIAPGKNPNLKLPIKLYRGRLSMKELMELAKLPFEPARDESQNI